jgi:DNA-binding NtrC family response regulator
MERMATCKQAVLVIEDDCNLRNTLAIILQRAGYAVASTPDAAQSYRHLQKNRTDLIILDINVLDPGGSSLELEIQRLYPLIPVILLIDHPSSAKPIANPKMGVCGYLVKPIEPSLILACVFESLGGRPMAAIKSHPRRSDPV